jgi:hypothetical protein
MKNRTMGIGLIVRMERKQRGMYVSKKTKCEENQGG